MILRTLHLDGAAGEYGDVTRSLIRLEWSRDGVALVAFFDAPGAWGYGGEAAAWTQDALADRWSSRQAPSIRSVLDDIHEIAGRTPREYRESDFGAEFDGAVFLARGTDLFVAAAGACTVVALGDAEHTMIFRPRMLIDDLLASGKLSPETVNDFPHKDICIGPYLGGDVEAPVTVSGPHEVPEAGFVVAGYRRVVAALVARSEDSLKSGSAREIQQLATSTGLPAVPLLVARKHNPLK